jgi:hypothetical protein
MVFCFGALADVDLGLGRVPEVGHLANVRRG